MQPCKKNLTVFQNSYQETINTPVYGQGTVTLSGRGGGYLVMTINNNSPYRLRCVGGLHNITEYKQPYSSNTWNTANNYSLYLDTDVGSYLLARNQSSATIDLSSYIIGYSTQSVTKWNTKWHKLSA